MNIKQVGQVAAVSTLSGLATRYLLNRFLSDYTSEKVRNIASLAIGLGCGFSTRNCSLKTLLSSIGIVGGNLLSLKPLTDDQFAYADLKKAEAKSSRFSIFEM